MYSQSGELNGIKWSSEYLGGRNFEITVGDLKQSYECGYEPIFGVDVADYANMNSIMDKMQEEIESR